LVNWIIGNIDRVVIARVFASKEVGLYASAYNMLYNPTAALMGVLQPVFFSASVRISDDKERVSAAYLALLNCIAVFVVPLFAGLSAIATTFVLAIYGPAWYDAGAILSPIALVMPLFLAWGLTTPVVWAGGQPGREWKIQLPLALLWVATTWMAAQISPAAVGWAVVALAFIRFSVMLVAASRLMHMDVQHLWNAVRGGLLLAATCALVMGTLDRWLLAGNVTTPAYRLLADIVVGGTTMLAGFFFFPGLLTKDATLIIAKIAGKLPKPIANLVNYVLLRRQT
jgi:O-antigen/teichoic acid export membrane protein